MQIIKHSFSFLKRHNSDEGFTIIEVLVSLFIFLLLVLIVYLGLTSARRLIYQSINEINFSIQLLQLEDYIRKEMRKIRIPFWIGKYSILINDTNVDIPYYYGEKNNHLFVSFENKQLKIISQNNIIIRPFPAFKNLVFLALIGEENQLLGIRIIIYGKFVNTKGVSILYRFGSNPFWVKNYE